MYLHVHQDDGAPVAELDDGANIFHLSVLVAPELAGRLGQLLAARPWGSLDPDGEHAWLDVAALRHDALDAGATEEELDRLIAYAERHAWLDADRTHVRAHIEQG